MGKNSTKTSTISSDALHNKNCFAYLTILRAKALATKVIITTKYSDLSRLFNFPESYDENYAYGDAYSYILETLEAIVDRNPNDPDLDNLIYAVYNNDNQIIRETRKHIGPICAKTRPMVNPKTEIANAVKDTDGVVNNHVPAHLNNFINELKVYPHFKPQNITNIPSINHYSYTEGNTQFPTEYRFSTQAQIHYFGARINPLFKRWLILHAARNPVNSDKEIPYVYFNNMGLDGDDFSRRFERPMSEELQALENDKDLRGKIAVITLPSVKGWMEKTDYEHTDKDLNAWDVYQEFHNVLIKGKSHPTGISDFSISPATRKLLFPDNNPTEILQNLLVASFKAQGIDAEYGHYNTISLAQKQAIWFHFIKFELTNHIINTLKPSGINFTCKSGIDRGAVSSCYYNLMKSFSPEVNRPLSREEFDTALHAAATNAHGRGLNYHRTMIWNAIDVYVDANYDALIIDNRKSWLIFWRDMNCPHVRVKQLINDRKTLFQAALNKLDNGHPLKTAGQNILDDIKNQSNLSGQRLLLEVLSRTHELLLSLEVPGQLLQDYKDLADEIPVKNPALEGLAGLMKAFAGLIACIVTFGSYSRLMDSGLATFKSAYYYERKDKLATDMNTFAAPWVPVNS